MSTSIPTEGWHQHKLLGLTYVSHQPGGLLSGPSAPEREGYECFFVARHVGFTRFSYRQVKV